MYVRLGQGIDSQGSRRIPSRVNLKPRFSTSARSGLLSINSGLVGFVNDLAISERRHAFGDKCVRHRAQVAPGHLTVGEKHSRPVE
jgi:hypothetical protein